MPTWPGVTTADTGPDLTMPIQGRQACVQLADSREGVEILVTELKDVM